MGLVSFQALYNIQKDVFDEKFSWIALMVFDVQLRD